MLATHPTLVVRRGEREVVIALEFMQDEDQDNLGYRFAQYLLVYSHGNIPNDEADLMVQLASYLHTGDPLPGWDELRTPMKMSVARQEHIRLRLLERGLLQIGADGEYQLGPTWRAWCAYQTPDWCTFQPVDLAASQR